MPCTFTFRPLALRDTCDSLCLPTLEVDFYVVFDLTRYMYIKGHCREQTCDAQSATGRSFPNPCRASAY